MIDWKARKRAGSDERYRLRRPLLKRIKELEANVAVIEAQRDAAVDACRAFVEAWEKSHQLVKTDVALRMARIVIDAAANAPAESSS